MNSSLLSRREFVRRTAILATAVSFSGRDLFAGSPTPPLEAFAYADVTLNSDSHKRQLTNTHAVLMGLNEDGLMRPFRAMSGLPAPGEDIGGWYTYKADYDYRKDSAGLCPGGTFGQWVSALSRYYAVTGDAATHDRVLALNRAFAKSVGGGFFQKNRFPAYCYDKLVCGLIDSHQFVNDPDAFAILGQTTDLALPELPPHAIDRELSWRFGKAGDISYTWDEPYTLPENLFLAYQRGAGDRYKQLAVRFLLNTTYFEPLAAGKNVFAGKHAYSYVNALNSAMQAYFILGSEMHLRAARNAFEMLVTTQSFATGGWGPDEQLREPNTGALAASLVDQHQSFETPCGAYAHFKLTRALLRVTRDASYGDSMERIMYNSVLGAKPLQSDGTAFYYSDYSYHGHKGYSKHRWPCCSGTLPQIAADYFISAYFHDANDIYVNLYLPSTLNYVHGSLTITGEYPFVEVVQLDLKADHPSEFGIYLRIPTWTKQPSVSVTGQGQPLELKPGTFATLRRTWKSGDRIELHLPMTTRLEAIDPQHPDIVALMYGPLVLFPVTNAVPSISRAQLLAAQRSGPKTWQVQAAAGPFTLIPFTEINDQPYTTYLRLT
jgi:DUF1680 family protein